MTDIDPDTGLPIVPEGHYWRVAYYDDLPYSYPIVKVGLEKLAYRKNGKLKRKPTVIQSLNIKPMYYFEGYMFGKGTEFSDDYSTWVQNAILGVANEIMENQEKSLREAELTAIVKTYTGTYPPKTLSKGE